MLSHHRPVIHRATLSVVEFRNVRDMEFFGKSTPASENEIKRFEVRHDVVLPEAYRQFLLEQNGGSPLADGFDFPDGSGGSVVNKFFPLGEQYSYNLDQMCRSLDWPEAYTSGVLRIGIDTGGSGLFLATSGKNAGCVLFVDREETLRGSAPVVLANSFDGFLAILSPV